MFIFKKEQNSFWTIIGVIFTVIGILVTIYLSVFYVPRFFRDMRSQKIDNINRSLIETVQELVYNKQELKTQDIEAFIKGKELEYNVIYPFSIKELLIQVQGSFMDMKFIPLQERIAWINSVSNTISTIKPAVIEKEAERPRRIGLLIGSLSILVSWLGIVVALLGFYSIYARSKNEQKIKEERDRAIRTTQERINEECYFLNLIERTLQTLDLEVSIPEDQVDSGYDYQVKTKEDTFFLECSVRLTDDNIHRVLYNSVKLPGKAVLVLKEKPCDSFIEQIKQHNINNKKNPILLATGSNENDLREQFQKIFG